MPERTPVRIGVVCEDVPDFELTATLVDRVLCERIDWLRRLHEDSGPDVLAGVRAFCGAESGRGFLKWSTVGGLARERQVRVHGKFGEEKGAPDARTARDALMLFVHAQPQPNVVLLVRDTDGDEDRCSGLQQARRDPGRSWPFPVVLGAAHAKRECWVLSGFEPLDDGEERRLSGAREALGFDPRLRSEELNATSEQPGVRRSAKQVCDGLMPRERQQRCFAETPLKLLRQRGERNGLKNFLDYVEKYVVDRIR